MKDTVILSMALGVVSTVASGILAFANLQTKDARDAAALADKSRALEQVLPAFDNQPLTDKIDGLNNTDIVFYPARQGGQLIGLAGQGITDKGFGGRLEVLVGLNPDGQVRKVVVTKHTETPGLGTIATDRKAVKTLKDLFGSKPSATTETAANSVPPCTYLDQFEAYNLGATRTLTLDKDGGQLTAVSGATISSRAVADAVSRVAQAFAANRDKLTSPAASN